MKHALQRGDNCFTLQSFIESLILDLCTPEDEQQTFETYHNSSEKYG